MQKKLIFIICLLALACILVFTNRTVVGKLAEVLKNEKKIEELAFNYMFKDICNVFVDDYNSGKYGNEMYVLASGGVWGGYGNIVVYTNNNKPIIIFYQSSERYMMRELGEEEYGEFCSFIQNDNVDSLTDWDSHAVDDGIEYQYMHLTKNKIVSFYMNNPDVSAKDVAYSTLVNKLFGMTETGNFTVHYNVDKFVNKMNVLIHSEDNKVQSVWKNGDDFRVLIEKEDKFSWYKFSNNLVGEIVDEPNEITMENAWGDIPASTLVKSGDYSSLSGFSFEEHLNNYPWEVSWNSYLIRSLRKHDTNQFGLWLTKTGEEPVLIAEGTYGQPVVIPDTDWVVCANADKGWAHPNKIVKINLKTFEEFVVDIMPADTLEPIVYVNNKLLIARYEDGSKVYERYLYDVFSDKVEKVQGDFDGLFDIRERFLQKTSKQNEYYAVQSRNYNDPVVIGKLNVDNLTFTKTAEYIELDFNSMNMWVDEDNAKVYVVKNGDLLELPYK